MQVKTLILGAGAAGMMCAAHAGRDTLVVDHAKSAGEKIRISGGGRCNFTNMYAGPENFISANPHFAKSALSRYTQWDFIELVDKHRIRWHEKTLGQLFCDDSAKQIVQMLVDELTKAGATLWLRTQIIDVAKSETGFRVIVERDGTRTTISCRNLVLATGGKPIPKMGATDLALRLAEKFGLSVTETRPALVPFTFSDKRFAQLSGIALPVRAQAQNGPPFDEAALLTHRGLSGPAMLQISSYWREGEEITLNLDPQNTLATALKEQRQISGRKALRTELGAHLPSKLVAHLANDIDLSGNLADQSDAKLDTLCAFLQNWTHVPTGSEGYRTAEVMTGGVDTNDLSSKTMAAKNIAGLHVIGEAVDVTGWLGGFNFQWAWASGVAAGRAISEN